MRTIKLKGTPEPILVEKIFCIGRNYAAHAAEMSSEVESHPVVFLKPTTALMQNGGMIEPPAFAKELHHEVEMVVLIGKGGKNITKAHAYDHVAGYAVGLDMTLRDVQAEAMKKGLPWTVAKGFDTSAPISAAIDKSNIANPHDLEITLRVNGKVRQHSNTRFMLFRIDTIISYLSTIFTLERGDLIFTGTPDGVSAVVPGDVLDAELQSVGAIQVSVAGASALRGERTS